MSASTAFALPFDPSSPVWADVTPVYQDDGPSPLCPILYSPDYSKAMDLVRALLPQDELSPRTLALTEHLSQLCPSNYTIWHYRARILIHGPEDGRNGLGNTKERLQNELEYLNELAAANMKVYQVWQHRKLVVKALGNSSYELPFIQKVLDKDSKNYHTWVYRQWVLSHFGGLPRDDKEAIVYEEVAGHNLSLWQDELSFVENLLKEDARNNSAWNHRYFCIFGTKWAKNKAAICDKWWKLGDKYEAIVKSEIAFAKGHVAIIPNNASAWNYLRGVSRLDETSKKEPFTCALNLALSLVPSNEEAKINPAVDAGGKTPSLALEWLFDHAESIATSNTSDAKQGEIALRESAIYIDRLCIADPIRRRYWQFRLVMLNRKIVKDSSS